MGLVMSDYYIRERDNEEARGPYSIGKLATLVESGQITKATLYFDEDKSAWLPLGDSVQFSESLFPERRKLILRTVADDADAVGRGKDAAAPTAEPAGPDVNEMLAAAEGRTEETRHLRKRQRSAEAAGYYLCPVMGLAFAMSGFSLLYPNLDFLHELVSNGHWGQLLQAPFVWIGFVDLFIALCCFLAVTDLFPFVRVRAALGCGFALYVGWAAGDNLYLMAMAAAMVGIWIATCTQRMWLMLAAFAAMLGGLGALVWMALSGRFELLYGPLTS
jgi:hypothetical protein